MEKPSIKLIDGKEIEAKREPVMKDWRMIVKYENDFKDGKAESMNDALERQLDILARFYEIDDLAEKLVISDIIPAFKAVSKYIMSMVFSKLQNVEVDEKNVETAKE